MTVAETLLVFAVAPLAVTAVLAALTLRPDPKSRRRRYRPGQPWEHEPLWYAPHSAQPAGHGVDTAAQPHGRTQALGSSVYGEVGAGDSHRAVQPAGQRATAATAPAGRRGGPLGGARGTW